MKAKKTVLQFVRKLHVPGTNSMEKVFESPHRLADWRVLWYTSMRRKPDTCLTCDLPENFRKRRMGAGIHIHRRFATV